MKALMAILLTASAAFAQASVKYEWAQPGCGSLTAFEALQSTCPFTRLQVTAHSDNPATIGFLITVTYRDKNGIQKITSAVVLTHEPNRDFLATFVIGDVNAFIPDFNPVLAINVNVQELLPGGQANK